MADIDEELSELEKSKKKATEDGPPGWRVRQKRLEQLMVAIVIVLFIGFAGMFVAVGQMMVDSLKDNRGSTKDFSNQINEQNEKIDELTKAINEQKTIQKN